MGLEKGFAFARLYLVYECLHLSLSSIYPSMHPWTRRLLLHTTCTLTLNGTRWLCK